MTRLRLSEATLAQLRPGTIRPDYARRACCVGWVHFGPGAFHRAHQAYYADRLLARDPHWAVSAVALHSDAVRSALLPQDYLYCLAELGPGAPLRVIGALHEILHAPTEPAAVFARLESPATRLITLTVTEKGYCLAGGALDPAHPDIEHDLASPEQPRSVIGFLTEGLRRRHAAGHPACAVVSCDNLADNGAMLRAAVLAFAARRSAPLAHWIEQAVAFPRTMVDSITPATDAPLRERVALATGLTDAWPVQRETFTQWVIEDVPAMRIADWASVGVQLTRDVTVYEQAKLRLLNAAHSTLAYVGLLRGHTIVAEAMTDAPLAHLVEQLMRKDIAPCLSAGGRIDIDAYIEATLARFRNPSVHHRLEQIAWDGSQKLPVRLLPTLTEALAAGRPLERLAVPVAAWIRFIVERARSGRELTDPLAGQLLARARECPGDPTRDVARFLELHAVFPQPLAAAAAFRSAVVAAYRALSAAGALAGDDEHGVSRCDPVE